MQITKLTPLPEIIKIGEQCDKCGHCCSHGSGFMVAGDKEKIAKFLKIAESELETKFVDKVTLFNTTLLRPKLKTKKNLPYGSCVFLNDNKCSINEVKPLQCRTGNCFENSEELSQWFVLNYLVNSNDSESMKQYEIYKELKETNIK